MYYGEGRTARLANLRTIIPRGVQRAVGPFTVCAVPHPITATPGAHSHARAPCSCPCPKLTGEAYTTAPYPGTHTPTSYPPRTATTSYHPTLSNTWRWDPPHPIRRTRARCADTFHAWTQTRHRTLNLKAEATIRRVLEGESHLMVEGLTEHILIAAMYATAAASRLWKDRPSPPLAQAVQDAPSTGPTAEDIHQVLPMRALSKTEPVVRAIQLVHWDAMDAPPATAEVHILKNRNIWGTVGRPPQGETGSSTRPRRRGPATATRQTPPATRQPRPPQPRGSPGSAALRLLLGAGGARRPPPPGRQPRVDTPCHPLHGPHAPPLGRHRAAAPNLAHGPARHPAGGPGDAWHHDQASVPAEGRRPHVQA